MSVLTSVSFKEEHINDYKSLKQYLHSHKISMGDFIIDRWKLKVNEDIFGSCFVGEEG